jgi:hypothetical protein
MVKMAPRSETAIVVAAAQGDKDRGRPLSAPSSILPGKFSRQSDSGIGELVRYDTPAMQTLKRRVAARNSHGD